ncbi:MAG: energy-coupling factor transporter ATPase [Bacillota bacterium]|jgi:energy-coupling factor transport system ATP-binding protein
MSIKINDVSFIYMPGTPFEKTALKNINLSIKDGEFVGVIGHTGSGKSTLAQHFNGLLKPSKGTIMIDDALLNGKKTTQDLCKKVGLVFQYPEYQLFAETVFEDVAFGPRNLGVPESIVSRLVKEFIELVGLDYASIKERSPFTLSGGQKRRVAIAGVLAMQPNTIVLDEPTAGLDPAGRKEIINLIWEYHKRYQKTVIWISHNMDEIARLASRLIVMSRGEVFMDGVPQEIFTYEKELISIGLGIPDAAALVRRLKARGKPLPGQAITVNEALGEIENWLRGKQNDR